MSNNLISICHDAKLLTITEDDKKVKVCSYCGQPCDFKESLEILPK